MLGSPSCPLTSWSHNAQLSGTEAKLGKEDIRGALEIFEKDACLYIIVWDIYSVGKNGIYIVGYIMLDIRGVLEIFEKDACLVIS